MNNTITIFTEPTMTPWNVLFCPVNSPRPKYFPFTTTEKHHVLTFKRLEPAGVWHFLPEKWPEWLEWMNWSSQLFSIFFWLINWMIDQSTKHCSPHANDNDNLYLNSPSLNKFTKCLTGKKYKQQSGSKHETETKNIKLQKNRKG